MKINDFEKTLDRFGTNLDAWPADLAGDGRALLSQSPEASGAYNALLQIEALIAGNAPRIDPARAARRGRRRRRQSPRRTERPYDDSERRRCPLLA
jgi:hypothetical protein